MEPRLLFDGAVTAAAADTATDQAFAAHHDGAAQSGDGHAADASVPPAAQSPVARALEASQSARADQGRTAIFIDAETAGSDRAAVSAANERADTDVYVVDAADDGLATISKTLDAQSDYQAVTIIGHEAGDKLSLGTTELSQQGLDAFAERYAAAGRDGELRVFDQSILDDAAQNTLADGSWMDSSDVQPLFVLQADQDGSDAAADDAGIAASVNDYSADSSQPGIIFVDTGVDNYQSLVDQFDPSAEVVLIDRDSDGVEQIQRTLDGRTNIGAIHIISHGGEGEVTLGTATLNAESIRGEYADELQDIGASLSERADILIYGCNFTVGESGREAASLLARQTGADVAASSDDTGSVDLNGDWDLETHIGEIEARAIDASAWSGRLADPVNLNFSNPPTLVSGTANQPGAVYRFSNVSPGIDALVTIDSRSNAQVSALDENANGVAEGFSPTIQGQGANGYVQFSFRFVDSGTNNARVVTFTASSLDVDATSETIQFRGTNNYTVESNTYVTATVDATNSNVNVRGGGPGAFPTSRTDTRYIVSANYSDVTGFTYRAGVDGNTSRQTALLFENVNTGNSANINFIDPVTTQLPAATNDRVVTSENTAVTFRPQANDDLGVPATTITRVNGTAITAGGAAVAVPNGSVQLTAGGDLIYTPASGFGGTDSFTYTIRDANGRSSTATVSAVIDNDRDGVANVDDIDDDNDGIVDTVENSHPVFTPADFINNGSAQSVNDDPTLDQNEFRLTPDLGGQVGSINSQELIDFSRDFTVNLGVYLGIKDGAGADGITIFFHNDPAGQNATGQTGQGIGARGLQNGIAIEFDTFDNGTGGGDIPDDHVSIFDTDSTNFDYLSAAQSVGNIEDGQFHDAVVTWNASTQTMVVTLNGQEKARVTTDLVANYFGGAERVFFGAAASTGGFSNEHIVRFDGASGSFYNQDGTNIADPDDDGLINSLDIDSDNDGITDNVEAQTTAGYKAPSGMGGTAAFRDANGDGLDDNYDAGALGAAGGIGLTPVDTDSDGVPDYIDTDSDDDGTSDIEEAGHATTTLAGTDSDHDGLDDAFDTVQGFDVNDDNIAGDNGGADGDYSNFTLRDADGDTNANEAVPNRTSNDASPPVSDLDYRDNIAALVAQPDRGSTDEDVTLNVDAASGLLANDSGPAGQVLTISEFAVAGRSVTVDPVNGGTTTISGIGTLTIRADGAYDFVPAANYNGVVPQVTYTVVAGVASRTTSTLDLTVNAIDDAPQNNLPDSQVVGEDSVIIFSQANGNAITIQDVDNNSATVRLSASNGLITLGGLNGLTFSEGDGAADGAMTFSGTISAVNAALEGARLVPNADYIGNASLTVQTSSGSPALTDTDTLQISYTPVADIADDTATTNEDTSVTIDVLANDSFENPDAAISAIDGSAITAGGDAVAVANGSVRLLANGQLQFTPVADYNGDTSFNYTVTSANNTETATVTVSVNPINDAPTVSDPLPDRTGQDGDPITIAAAGAFSDADNDTLTYTADGLPDGLVIDAATGEITGNLPADASVNSPYSITVTANDGNGGTVSDTFTISSTNVAPTAGQDAASTGENNTTAGNVLANDVDGGNDGDTLSVSQVAGAAASVGQPVAGSDGGSFVINADGSYTFDPGADFDNLAAGESLTTQVLYQVSDGQGGTDTTALTVTVNGANDAPTVVAPLDNQSSQDGETVSIATAGGFNDLDDSDTLVYTATALPPGLSIDADTGEITGTLDADASQAGPYNVTVTATDGSGEQTSSSFNWAVANPPPVANGDTGTTSENVDTAGNVLANDVDGGNDSDTLAVSQVGGNAAGVGAAVDGDNGGTFTIGANGDYSFAPGAAFDYLSAGETASTRVTYTVSDGQGGTSSSVLTVTVTGTNDAPVAGTIPAQSDRDGESILLPTSGFFDDADANDTPSYAATGLPAGLSIDPDSGVISGQIDSDASQGGDNGTYSVTVSIDDGQGGTTSTTFDWVVANPPVSGVDDTDTTTEDAAISRAAGQGVLVNDIDPDNDTLSVAQVENDAANVGAGVTGSNGGLFTVNADGSYSFDPGNEFQYLSEGESATTSVIYQVSDGQGGLDTARLTVTVTGANDAPTVDIPPEDLANSDGETVSVPTAGAFADVDANDSLTFSATGLPPGLSINTATGEITGQLAADASQGGNGGVYTITVTADDGHDGGQASAQFDWTISNRPPIANDDSAATTENAAAISGNVSANDTDGGADTDALTVTQVNMTAGNVGQAIAGSNGGTFTVNADGSYTFDGAGDFDGLAEGQTATTAVTYQISDGQGGTDTATLSVTVTGTNDAPVVRTPLPDLAANDGDPVSVSTAGSFRDPDANDTLRYSVSGLPAGLTINQQTGVISGTIDRSASQNNAGSYSVAVTASDGQGGTVTDTFTWSVTNRRPVAGDDTADTTENAAATGNVLGNDSDGAGDTDPLIVSQVDGNAAGVGTAVPGGNGGAFTINADGSYTFEPGADFDDLAAGETRLTSVIYQVSDGQGGFDSARLSVTVTGTNDAPVVVGDGLQDLESNNSESVSVPTAGAFSDADTDDTLTYSVAGLPDGLTIDPNTGIISGTVSATASGGGPNNDGVYLIEVTASDGTAQTTSQFSWTIDNLAVSAHDDVGQTDENQRLDVDAANGVTSNDDDADGGGIFVTGVGGDPANVGMTVDGSNGGQFVVNEDGSYSFLPNADFDYLAEGEQSTTSVTYQIADGQGASDTGRLTITVTGTNDAPTVVHAPAPVSSNDGDTVSVPTAGSFTDIDDSDNLAYSATNLPPGLTIDSATGIISGRLDAAASAGGDNNDGVYAVTVTAADGNGGTVDTTFTWTAVNRPPIANNDVDTVTVGDTATGSVSANDRDGGNDTDPLTVASVDGLAANIGADVTGGNGGTFVINTDGSYTFDPGSDFDRLGAGDEATTSVVYEISDGQGGVDEARITVTVTGVNDAPTTTDLIDQSNNDGEAISVPTAGAFDDVDDNDSLTYSAGTTLPPGLTIDAATGRISGALTPAASQGGPNGDGVYTVTITATDAAGAMASTDFTWTVTNSAPVAVNDSAAVTENQAASGNVITGVDGVGADRDGGADTDTLTVVDVDGTAVAAGQPASVTGDLGGTFTVNADGSYDFAPGTDFDNLSAGETAITGITYRISDGQGGFDSARLAVTVTGTNDDPTVDNPLPDLASNDGDNTNIATAGAFADLDANDTLTYQVSGLPDGVSINADTGEIVGRLSPSASQTNGGVYDVTVTAVDSQGATVSDTFTWTIANPSPTAATDMATTDENATVTRDAANGVLANDADGNSDTDMLTVAQVGGTAAGVGQSVVGTGGGTFVVGADGSYTFDPGADFEDLGVGESRNTSVSYQVSDGQGGTATSRLVITVTGDNDAPTVGAPLNDLSSRDGDTVSASVAGAFQDADTNDTLTYSALDTNGDSTLPPGLVLDSSTGRITGTVSPDASVGGPYTVTITATDSAGAQVSDEFVWQIDNPAPEAAPDTAATDENDDLSIDAANGVLANDVDGGNDSDTLTVSQIDGSAANIGQATAGSNGGLFTVNADGSYAFATGTDFDDLSVGETRATQVSYQVSDGQGGFDTNTLTVTVTGTNDAPTVVAPTPDRTGSDGDAVSISTAGAFSDRDASDQLTYSAAGLPAGFTIDADTGLITGTLGPDASQNGPFTIQVTANDGQGGTVSDTFALSSTNVAPIAIADQGEATENGSATGNVLANDADGGNDTDTLSVAQVAGATGNVGQATAGDNGGAFTVSANGAYSFDPGADFDDLAVGETRTTSISYQVSDGQGGVDTSSITVLVTGTNDAPTVAQGTPDQTASDGDTLSIAAGDAFADADNSDTLSYSASGLPAGLDIDPDTGLITGTLGPNASQNGPFTIAVTADDGNGGTVTDTFEISSSNVAPVALDDAGNTSERDPLNGDVLANDRDGGNDSDIVNVAQVAGNAANVGAATNGSNGGTFTIDANGQYTFDPGTDFSNLRDGDTRASSITYQISDGQGGVATATLTVTVTGGNDAPVVTDPTADQSAQDGDAISIPAGDAFTDVEGDNLSYTATGLPDGLTIDPDSGLITGNLPADASQNGPFSIQVTADDGNGGSATETFVITSTNVAPVAASDQAATAENDAANGNVLANDRDGGNDSDALVVSQVNGSAGSVGQAADGSNGGTFTVAEDGSYVFQPGADFDDLAVGETRTTSISYQVSDGQGGVDSQTLIVTVSGSNDAPVVAQGTPDQTASDGDTVSIPAGAAFSDADASDQLVYSATGLPAGLSIDSGTGAITGTLAADASANGPFSIVVTADDGNGGTVTDSFTLTSSNVAPVAAADANTTEENTSAVGNVLANDVDGGNDTDTLTVSQVDGAAGNIGQPTGGSAGGAFTINADGTYLFNPGSDFDDLGNGESRSTQIGYQVSDGQGGVDTQTVTVTVTGTNDAPTVAQGTANQSASDGDAVAIAAGDAFTDVEGDDLSYSATGLPAGVTIDPDTGAITGTLGADASANGPYTITVTADDGNGGTVSNQFTLTASNVAPVAAADQATADENTPASGNVLANDVDGGNDSDALTVSQVGGDANGVGQPVAGSNGGAFTIDADGSYTFVPGNDFDDLNTGQTRTSQISYQVSDGQGGFDTQTVAVTVTGTNDAPVVAQPTSPQRAADGDTVSIAAGDAFADTDNGNLSYSATGLPAGLTIDADTGQITGTLGSDASVNGPYTITVTADDGNGGTIADSFTLTSTNTAPIAQADTAATGQNGAASGDVLANDRDGGNDSDALTVSQVDGSANNVGTPTAGSNGGAFTIGADGSYTFDPGTDFADLGEGESRTTTTTYQVSDGQGGVDTQTVTVTVIGANDAPAVARPTPNQTANDGDTLAIPAGDAFNDAEGDNLSYSATGLPAGLSIDPDTGLITGTLGANAAVNGPYTIAVTADDGNGGTVTDTFQLTPSNTPPVAAPDTATAGENTPVTGNVLANDADGGNDSDALTVSQVAGNANAVGQPTAGSTGGAFTIAADGSYRFDPGTDFDDLGAGESRTTNISYQVSDGQGGVDTQTVTVTVTGANDAPTVAQPIPDQTGSDGDTLAIAAGEAFADVEGDNLSYSATGLPAGLSIDPDTGLITGTLGPDASANGPYTIVVTANDGNGGTVSNRFSLTPSNTAPTASPDTATTGENTPVTGNVLANDVDGGNDGDDLTVRQVAGVGANVSQPTAGSAGGAFTINADGSYTFDPGTDFDDLAAGDVRTTTITYQVSDGQGGVDTQTLTTTVTGVNDAPAAGAVPLADRTGRDSQNVVIGASEAFRDIDGDTLTYSATNLPPGLVIDADTGVISGRLANNASVGGPYAVTVTARDGNGGSLSQSFDWTITNDPPVANDDMGSTTQDRAITVTAESGDGVLGNDSDPDGDGITLTAINGNAGNIGQPVAGDNGGLFTIGPDGGYTFDPNGDFAGLQAGQSAATTVTYRINDDDGGSVEGQLVVVVNGANDAPVVVAPTPDQSARDGDRVVIPAGEAFRDADQDPLTYSASGLPAGLAIDADSGLITGTLGSDASANGPYTVTVTADDGNGATVTNTFTLTPANRAPNAAPDIAASGENNPVAGNVLANDVDGGNDRDPLTVSQVGGDAANVGAPTAGSNGGTFTVNADGSYRFNPGADFDDLGAGETRTSTISYQVSDGQGGVDTQTVVVTVTGTNDAPAVVRPTPDQSAGDGDAVTIAAGDAFVDAEGDDLSYTATGLPAGLAIDPDTGLITGTLGSDASANGPYTITVTASDGNGGTAVNTFRLAPVNAAPVSSADTATTGENQPATGNVLANDRDGGNDSDALSVSQVGGSGGNVGRPTTGSTGGLFTVNADGSYRFDPGNDFDDLGTGETRTSTVSYQASDGQGGVATQTLTVTVTGANDAPAVTRPTSDQSAQDGDTVSIAAGDAFTDSEGDALRYSAVGLPEGLSVDPATGLITGTLSPGASINGPYTITVTASDGNGGTASDSFDLTPGNVAPRAGVDTVSVDEDTPVTGNVLANDADGGNDNDPLTVAQVDGDPAGVGTPVNAANGGQFTINADGSYRFNPNGDFDDLAVGESRTTTVSYQVSDGNGGTDTATLTVTVSGTNDAPAGNDDVATTDENTPATGNVLVNDTDADASDTLTVAQVGGDADNVGAPTGGSNGGQFTVNADGTYSFDPDGDFDDLGVGESRTTTVSYQVSDGNGGTDTATLTITVNGVNNAPGAGDIPDDRTPFGAGYENDVSDAFADNDLNETLTYSAQGLPAGLSIDPDTGVISGNPVGIGSFSITVTATDGAGATASRQFDLRVLPPAVVSDDSGLVFGAGPGAEGIGSYSLVSGGFLGTASGFESGVSGVDLTVPDLFTNDLLGLGLPTGALDTTFEPINLRYQATETDGSPLPGTLTVNADTGEITGQLPPGMDRARLTVIGIDDNGNTRTREVWVDADGHILQNGGGEADTDGKTIEYRRVQVVVGIDGSVTVESIDDAGNTMRAQSIRVDGNYLDIRILDPEARDVSGYTGQLTSGAPLPDGLSVDTQTGRVSGEIPAGTERLSISIVAHHNDGDARVFDIDLDLSNSDNDSATWQPLDAQVQLALASSGDVSESTHGARIAAALGFN
ncbi:hypothetical protein GCM10028792_09330 [Salinisphaera aquimarina]